MELTEQDVMNLLQKWVKTPDGKATLEANGFSGASFYNLDRMNSLAEDLRRRIDNAFAEVTINKTKLSSNYDSENIMKIRYRTTGKNGITFTITFPEELLGRLSLVQTYGDWEDPQSYFGKTYHEAHSGLYGGLDARYGVYDILGLFTQGYSLGKLGPKGSWVRMYHGEVGDEVTNVRALGYRAGNPFITDTIDEFIADHINEFPDLEVLYPTAWGGTL